MSWRLAAAVVLAGVALCACGTQSAASAVHQWASTSSLHTAVEDLLGDSSRVHAAIVTHQGAQLVRTTCTVLYEDALGTNDELPTPDAQLTTLLSNAYDGYVRAAVTCYDDASSASVRARVVRELAAAQGELIEAVLREEAVTGIGLGIKGIP